MEINGYTLIQTCTACPEQYDVMRGDERVGYLRLRHGEFSARLYGVTGREVYSAEPDGDGSFEDDERERYLTAAVAAIDAALRAE